MGTRSSRVRSVRYVTPLFRSLNKGIFYRITLILHDSWIPVFILITLLKHGVE